MTIGLILLAIAGILLLFGVGQRVLDKLRLTDRQALLFIALIIAGGFLPDISVTPQFSFNIGGALIPLILCAYLWIKAGNGEGARTLPRGGRWSPARRYSPSGADARRAEEIVIDPGLHAWSGGGRDRLPVWALAARGVHRRRARRDALERRQRRHTSGRRASTSGWCSAARAHTT